MFYNINSPVCQILFREHCSSKSPLSMILSCRPSTRLARNYTIKESIYVTDNGI